MKGLRPQFPPPLPETVRILSPQSCDEVNERLRAMALDEWDNEEEEEEECDNGDGTFRTPIAAIDAMASQALCLLLSLSLSYTLTQQYKVKERNERVVLNYAVVLFIIIINYNIGN